MSEVFDYTNRDYEGFRASMIAKLKEKMPEYSDFSQTDAGIVLIELLAGGLDILSYYSDIIANEVFLPSARERENVIKLCEGLSYKLSGITPSKVYQVFEITPQGTDFTIPKGFKVKTKKSSVEEEVIFELDEDLVILAGDNGLEQTVPGTYDYIVSVTQGYTVSQEVLGTSDASAYQKMPLFQTPVIEDSILLYVDEGSGSVLWTKVDSFLDSTPTSKEYKVSINDFDQATIEFGSGSSGKIPVAYTDGIVATYRVGGGVIGNVGADKIIELETELAGIVDTFNPEEPYVLGEEKEDIEEAKVKAPASLRTLWRAVTEQDFEDLAVTVTGVKYASAIYTAGTHTLALYILPTVGETVSSDLSTALGVFFEERRLLGITVTINSPSFVTQALTLAVKALPTYYNATVTASVNEYLTSKLAVGNFNFGEELILSSLMKDIMNIDGVKSVSFSVPSADVTPTASQIIKAGTITTTTTGGL